MEPGSEQEAERLQVEATRDDPQHQIYVRQAIEAGLADSDADRVEPVADVRKAFGLPE
jgi:hypothetical protein